MVLCGGGAEQILVLRRLIFSRVTVTAFLAVLYAGYNCYYYLGLKMSAPLNHEIGPAISFGFGFGPR